MSLEFFHRIDFHAIAAWWGLRIVLIALAVIVALKVSRAFIRRGLGVALADRPDDTLKTVAISKRRATLTQLLNAVASVLLCVVGTLMIFRELNFDIAPLLASAGVVGIAVGFGAQSLVKDIITGAFIILENQFDVGDVVKLGDTAGLCEAINLRTTVLRGLDGTVHIIPNGEIVRVSVLTKDWSRLVLDVEVAYGEDVGRVTGVLRGVLDDYAAANPGIVLEPPEILGVETLGASGVTIRSLVKTLPSKQWEAGRKVRALVKAEFDREKIEIPFPQQSVWLRSEEEERPSRVKDPPLR